MALLGMQRQQLNLRTAGAKAAPALPARVSRRSAVRCNAAANAPATDELGFKKMREGIKEASEESILTPRFYTTDFDEMEELFSLEKNPNLPLEELEAMLTEFKQDYNQKHFVRNESFKKAADNVQGPARKIFIEFLERSCTAEFSGFLLYKELGRRLKKTNPAVAEIFTLMSRDEARHAGFLNKAMSDFNLALDLGFLTRNRKYTFFKPKFIFYATFLSEKIGYWRYITIYRHLQRNPENQMYPLFEYFENWCQDENRHGDFFSAVLKAQPKFLNDWKAKLWSRFFCLSVYITMYLNDHQRTAFYESLGMNTRHFNQHVIIETNKSVARLFPQVPDCEHPEFFERMNKLVDLNQKVADIGKMDVPSPIKAVLRAPLIERMLKEITQIYFSAPMRSGTVDLNPALQSVY
uniref:magnesium-protoporphyrin IX monomethyl ester (oxidative) cyclase n=1 Tax=Dunaliella tertiolecta TaxID=3047 RepID=A0A7S3QSB4_DUNTE|mmetsp:Transcript_19834/g.55322  ORF Transcript_19834/g.55322 Transcript_19834/m.55322 type:complete len:409 (+) Transcript_19834:72-1298(+)|eukprot:CAMPEP_0202340458 /NCGR_PEP_ID=MMETSP1126-20121109/1891_1 /ASSEMBLY_ACC=CAM_ASM_000457 /TAXON_ID=3047 /ORGANISM="Dunaliella tertiolecta, Strain CCMP1320" /LENGTH=408 /DNA_ID=CAMNT_0048931171 /DNA_START=211 /DNA_END=1437 /DNA_ORIENTATION=-